MSKEKTTNGKKLIEKNNAVDLEAIEQFEKILFMILETGHAEYPGYMGVFQ